MSALEGQAAVITGASQGLGLAIARAYVQAGASVVLCARDAHRLEAAAADVRAVAVPGAEVRALAADVSQESDVTAVATAAIAAFPQLSILVNNAGIYGPIGRSETVDWAQWVAAINVNLLGSVLMCRALVPQFRRIGRGKIVQLSGGGAAKALPRFSAYAASKAGIVRFAETLAEELLNDRIDVNCIAPGALNTQMLQQALDAGPELAGAEFHRRSVEQGRNGGASVETAAELAVFLGSSRSDGITGRLLSAVWDPWRTLAAHREALRTSDIYTLRRIVPEDRGADWNVS